MSGNKRNINATLLCSNAKAAQSNAGWSESSYSKLSLGQLGGACKRLRLVKDDESFTRKDEYSKRLITASVPYPDAKDDLQLWTDSVTVHDFKSGSDEKNGSGQAVDVPVKDQQTQVLLDSIEKMKTQFTTQFTTLNTRLASIEGATSGKIKVLKCPNEQCTYSIDWVDVEKYCPDHGVKLALVMVDGIDTRVPSKSSAGSVNSNTGITATANSASTQGKSNTDNNTFDTNSICINSTNYSMGFARQRIGEKVSSEIPKGNYFTLKRLNLSAEGKELERTISQSIVSILH
jgi:hypothetical protein